MDKPELTDLAQVIYEAIQASGSPVSRRDIAECISRPNHRLTPYDVDLLNGMVDEGIVKAFQEQTGVVRREWRYCIDTGRNS